MGKTCPQYMTTTTQHSQIAICIGAASGQLYNVVDVCRFESQRSGRCRLAVGSLAAPLVSRPNPLARCLPQGDRLSSGSTHGLIPCCCMFLALSRRTLAELTTPHLALPYRTPCYRALWSRRLTQELSGYSKHCTSKRPNPMRRPSPSPTNLPASRQMLCISSLETTVLSHNSLKEHCQPGVEAMR